MSDYRRKRDEDTLRHYLRGEVDLFTYELEDLLWRLGLAPQQSSDTSSGEGNEARPDTR